MDEDYQEDPQGEGGEWVSDSPLPASRQNWPQQAEWQGPGEEYAPPPTEAEEAEPSRQEQIPESPTWESVAPLVQRAFPGMDMGRARKDFDNAIQLRNAREIAQERTSESPGQYIARRAIPVASAVVEWGINREYRQALGRYNEGDPNPIDFRMIADYERMLEIDSQRGIGGQILSGLASVPAVAGEFMLAGPALRGAGIAASWGARALGAGARISQVAGLAGSAAAVPLTVPTFAHHTYQEASARAQERGGQWYSPGNIAPAYTHQAMTAMVLGSIGRQANNIPGNSLGAVMLRNAARTGYGMGEMRIVEAVAGVTGLSLRRKDGERWHEYGTLGDLFAGRYGQGMGRLAVEAVTFAAFAGLHEYQSPGIPTFAETVDSFRTLVGHLRSQGYSRDRAASVIDNIFAEMNSAVRSAARTDGHNYWQDRSTFNNWMERFPQGPVRDFARNMASNDAALRDWLSTNQPFRRGPRPGDGGQPPPQEQPEASRPAQEGTSLLPPPAGESPPAERTPIITPPPPPQNTPGRTGTEQVARTPPEEIARPTEQPPPEASRTAAPQPEVAPIEQPSQEVQETVPHSALERIRQRQREQGEIRAPRQPEQPPRRLAEERPEETLSKQELEMERRAASARYDDIPEPIRRELEDTVPWKEGNVKQRDLQRETFKTIYAMGGKEAVAEYLGVLHEKQTLGEARKVLNPEDVLEAPKPPEKTILEKLSNLQLSPENRKLLESGLEEFHAELKRAEQEYLKRGANRDALERVREKSIRSADQIAQGTSGSGEAREGGTAEQPKKPKQKPPERGPRTLMAIIKDKGGLSKRSVIAHQGKFEANELEKNIPSIYDGKDQVTKKIVRRSGNQDLYEVAIELIREGHLSPPPKEFEGKEYDWLYEKLKERAKSLTDELEAQLKREHKKYVKELRDAEQAAIQAGESEQAVKEVVRQGESDGVKEGADKGRNQPIEEAYDEFADEQTRGDLEGEPRLADIFPGDIYFGKRKSGKPVPKPGQPERVEENLGQTPEEQLDILRQKLRAAGVDTSAPTSSWRDPDPLGLKKIAVAPDKEAAVLKEVLKGIEDQRATNQFQRLTVKDAYEKFGTGLSIREFQAVLARADGGSLRLGPYTEAIAFNPAPKFLIPWAREFKYFLEGNARFYGKRSAPASSPRKPSSHGDWVTQGEITKTQEALLGTKSYLLKNVPGGDASIDLIVKAIYKTKMVAVDAGLDMHERAHDIARKYQIDLDPNTLPRDVQAGLAQFDYEPNRTSRHLQMIEGWAEWLRMRQGDVLSGLSREQKIADAWGEAQLKRHPELLAKLDRIREMYKTFNRMSATDKARSFIRPTDEPSGPAGLNAYEKFTRTFRSMANWVNEAMFDRFQVAKRAESGLNFPEGQKPSDILAFFEYQASDLAAFMAENGPSAFTPEGKWITTGKPIDYIVKPLKDAFPESLVRQGDKVSRASLAAHAIHAVDEASKDRPAPFLEYFQEALAEMRQAPDWPALEETARRLTKDGYNATLRALELSGFASKELVERLIEEKPTYTYQGRATDEGMKIQNPIKSRGESGQELIDVFEAYKNRLKFTSWMVAEQKKRTTWDNAFRQPGMGQWAIEVTASEKGFEPHQINQSQLMDIFKKLGIDKDPLVTELMEQLGKFTTSYFSPAKWAKKGDNIYVVMKGGNPVYWKIGDKALYELITDSQMFRGSLSQATGMARVALYPIQLLAKNVRFGATTASHIFQLAQIPLDMLSFISNTKNLRLRDAYDLPKAYIGALRAEIRAFFGKEPKEFAAKLFHALHGENQQMFPIERDVLRGTIERSTGNRSLVSKGIDVGTGALEILNAGESAPRMLEMRKTLEKLGWNEKKIEDYKRQHPDEVLGLPFTDILLAFNASTQVTNPWKLGGNLAGEVNKLLPFFRPHIVSAVKVINNWRTNWKGALVGLGILALYKILEDLIYGDDPDYKQMLAHERAQYFHIKTPGGRWWHAKMIAGPNVPAVGIFTETIQLIRKNNPNYTDLAWQSLEALTPPHTPQPLGAILDVAANRRYGGGPVVPPSARANLTRGEQLTKYQAPYVAEQLTGGLVSANRLRLNPFEMQSPPHRSVQEFYDRLEWLREQQRSLRYHGRAFPYATELRDMERTNQHMARLFTEMRGDAYQGRRTIQGTGERPERERRDEIIRQQARMASEILNAYRNQR